MIVYNGLSPAPPLIILKDVIKEDGTITLLSNKVFHTTGKTRADLEKEVRAYYVPKFFTGEIALHSTDPPFYSVQGEVVSPGLQILMRPTTVLSAVQLAGGFTRSANKKKVQLIHQPSGVKYLINCLKAQQDPAADMQVTANDQIWVPRSWWK